MDEDGTKELDEDELYNSDAWHCVGFVAGVGAEEESANKARGFHRKHMLIILEECTGMPMPVLTAFQNTCTGGHNIILAVGNPDNEFDPLHRFCQQKNVSNYRISAMDYPNIVLKNEMYPGAVTQASIQDRIDVYGEGSSLYNAMVRGISPSQSEDSLIKLEWIEKCIDSDVDDSTGYNAVGVDVANSDSGDKAALAWGEGNTLKELQEFHCKNATHLAYNLVMSEGELIEKGYHNYRTSKIWDYGVQADCIGVDAVGVGVATVNAFVDNGYDCIALQGGQWEEAIPKTKVVSPDGTEKERSMYKFSTLRAQMYWQAREDIRLGLVSFKVADKSMLHKLKKELTIPKFDARNGTITVEKKEDIKKRMGGKSPNLADAFVYWNWCRHGYRLSRFGFLPIYAGG
jgi:hypothetical protein